MKGFVGVTDNDWSRNGLRRGAQGVRSSKLIAKVKGS
jgi:hypothetical protein